MRIPRKHIENTLKHMEKLHEIKHTHYREYYKDINVKDFQICTKVDFKKVRNTYGNIRETWGRLKHKHPHTYEFTSKTGSQYFITETGDVYRLSDHWGAVASCEWTLNGKGELRMSVFVNGEWEIGRANLQEFKIFRRKDDRRVDNIVNPMWLEKIKIVEPLAKKLYTLKCNPEFKTLPVEDKMLIGSAFGRMQGELNYARINVTN